MLDFRTGWGTRLQQRTHNSRFLSTVQSRASRDSCSPTKNYSPVWDFYQELSLDLAERLTVVDLSGIDWRTGNQYTSALTALPPLGEAPPQQCCANQGSSLGASQEVEQAATAWMRTALVAVGLLSAAQGACWPPKEVKSCFQTVSVCAPSGSYGAKQLRSFLQEVCHTSSEGAAQRPRRLLEQANTKTLSHCKSVSPRSEDAKAVFKLWYLLTFDTKIC